MATNRFFVSLDGEGIPLRQRNTVKAKPYVSASYDGDSFSTKPQNGAYPRKVVEVPKAIEWVGRATLADGSKVTIRSKSGPVGRAFVRYRYESNGAGNRPEDTGTHHETEEAWRKDHGPRYQLLAFARFETVEIRNWPVLS